MLNNYVCSGGSEFWTITPFLTLQKEYNEWIVKSHRHIVAVLEDAPSLRPPLDHLMELLPRLQCRYYSISSSPKVHKCISSSTVSLLFNIFITKDTKV